MLLVWTAILYSDDPTVLVLTVPAFLLVMATTFPNISVYFSQFLATSIETLTYPRLHEHKDIQLSATR
jgi:hypothetical protein